MKIKITHDKTGRYVAELVGIQWAYAQWKTPGDAVNFLIDVYKNIEDIKNQSSKQSFTI